MANWVKPNGTKISTNDEEHNIKKATELGWVLDIPKKKRTRKTPEKKGE